MAVRAEPGPDHRLTTRSRAAYNSTVAAPGTRATLQLTRLAISFTLHAYNHSENAGSYGAEAAAELGVPPGRVFKTLVTSVDGQLAVAVVPVARQLDLKAFADALGGKRARMVPAAQAERATGYVTGGISPVAQRRKLPVVIDSAALDWPTVYCSAGKRGLQMELCPQDLIRATGARTAAIGRQAA